MAPANFVDATFNASAGTAYHVWVRMRAEGDSLSNDSVHLQFSDSVTSAGAATQRIGTSSSAEFVLQNGSTGPRRSRLGLDRQRVGRAGHSGLFRQRGTHTLRIQQREDGAIVDQIVLSPDTYQTTPPGGRRDDTTILPESGAAPPPPACSESLTPGGNSYAADGGTDTVAVATSIRRVHGPPPPAPHG